MTIWCHNIARPAGADKSSRNALSKGRQHSAQIAANTLKTLFFL